MIFGEFNFVAPNAQELVFGVIVPLICIWAWRAWDAYLSKKDASNSKLNSTPKVPGTVFSKVDVLDSAPIEKISSVEAVSIPVEPIVSCESDAIFEEPDETTSGDGSSVVTRNFDDLSEDALPCIEEIDPVHDNFRSAKSAYPPDWKARTAVVKTRDNHRCQISGCPSLCALDVHHIVPVSNKGSHKLENLVTLCVLHHWLLPEHDLVKQRGESHRFMMISAYKRRREGRVVRVRPHFRRHETASVTDIERICLYYQLQCEHCGSLVKVDEYQGGIVVSCASCFRGWQFRSLLSEEVGTRLAECFRVSRNQGTFQFNRNWLPQAEIEEIEWCSACTKNGHPTLFVQKTSEFGKFHGCPNFRTSRCTNTSSKQRLTHQQKIDPIVEISGSR